MARLIFSPLRDLLLVIGSSGLLVLSFPTFDLGLFAWVGLAPLLIAIAGRSLKAGFGLAFLCGALFFIGIFRWILDFPGFTVLHQAVLCVYVSLFFGVFGLFFNFVSRRFGLTLGLLAGPPAWVSLEYIRSNLSFMALPWGLLGHSQYQHPVIIQICSLAGLYGVSFLVMLVNVAIAGLALRLVYGPGKGRFPSGPFISSRGSAVIGVTAFMIVSLVWSYGAMTLSRPMEGPRVKIAVIQGNIAQAEKWDRAYSRYIMESYTELTRMAAKERPDFIVWPETATPGAINRVPGLYSEVRRIAAEVRTAILLGSAQHQKMKKKERRDLKYLNSAFLIPPERKEKAQHYAKIHLMPFGEYLPAEDIISWERLDVPEVSSYVPGEEFTVFELKGHRFSTTICWENLFPDLVRQFVGMGAQFIVNITNEAWFGKTVAPYQFLCINVFRAVENKVFVVRCGNTGVSCFIDPHGRIVNRVTDGMGKDIFVRGFVTGKVIPRVQKTFYTQYGDFFAWICLMYSVAFLIVSFLRERHGSDP